MINEMMKRDRRKGRKPISPHRKGELNKLIDSLCQPLFEVDKCFIILDGFLHALIERNPPLSMRKFIRHNSPELLRNLRDNRASSREPA